MWKREDNADPAAPPRPEATRSAERTERAPSPARSGEQRATIGRSITIKGEVTGDEDLVIQGRIEGSVRLEQHSVTVGPEGEVKADLTGRIVTVEGRVVGDLNAEEQVILRTSSTVEGDITAPRVVLEDGARFRGGIDMGETAAPAQRTTQGQAAPARQTAGAAPQKADKAEAIGASASVDGKSPSSADAKSGGGAEGRHSDKASQGSKARR